MARAHTGRSVILHSDRDHARPRRFARLDSDTARRPLAGVVDKITEHLVKVLAVGANGVCWIYHHLDGDRLLGVELLHGAGQPVRGLTHWTANSGSGSGGSGARVREMVIDLAPHPLDLLADRRCELRLPLG